MQPNCAGKKNPKITVGGQLGKVNLPNHSRTPAKIRCPVNYSEVADTPPKKPSLPSVPLKPPVNPSLLLSRNYDRNSCKGQASTIPRFIAHSRVTKKNCFVTDTNESAVVSAATTKPQIYLSGQLSEKNAFSFFLIIITSLLNFLLAYSLGCLYVILCIFCCHYSRAVCAPRLLHTRIVAVIEEK